MPRDDLAASVARVYVWRAARSRSWRGPSRKSRSTGAGDGPLDPLPATARARTVGGLGAVPNSTIQSATGTITVTSVAGLLVGGVFSRGSILGTLNRLGGLALGLVLGLLAVWLITAACVFLPTSFAPVAHTVDRSFTARIVRSATPNGQHLVSSYLGHFSAGHASQAVQKDLRLLLGLPAKAGN